MPDFDEWYALWQEDIETEFTESGFNDVEHDDFCEDRYMHFISQSEDDLSFQDLSSCHNPQTLQEVSTR